LIPLVSVITATWRRHDMLLDRCIPSVQAQGYPSVEHVVVLRRAGRHPVEAAVATVAGRVEGTCCTRSWTTMCNSNITVITLGSSGWNMRQGSTSHYCDDDDSIRPDHCYRLAAALDANPDAGFAVSRMVAHSAHPTVVGWGPLAPGNVGSPMISAPPMGSGPRDVGSRFMERRLGGWSSGWLDAGVKYVNVDAETSDVWPSRFRVEA